MLERRSKKPPSLDDTRMIKYSFSTEKISRYMYQIYESHWSARMRKTKTWHEVKSKKCLRSQIEHRSHAWLALQFLEIWLKFIGALMTGQQYWLGIGSHVNHSGLNTEHVARIRCVTFGSDWSPRTKHRWSVCAPLKFSIRRMTASHPTKYEWNRAGIFNGRDPMSL